MLPLQIDVRLKNSPPKAVFGIIIGTGLWHLLFFFLIKFNFVAPNIRWTWLALHYDDPGPLQWLSALFTHDDFWHWFWNMFFLWIFGAPLEDRLGERKFIVLFFLCGIGGDLLIYIFYLAVVMYTGKHYLSVGIGSSGAIFGIVGITMYRFYRSKVYLGLGDGLVFPKIPIFRIKIPTLAFVLWMLGNEIYRTVTLADDGIGLGHLAHIGGFFVGLVAARYMRLGKASYDEIIWDKARDYFNQGWFPHSLERYDRLLSLLPKEPLIHEERARCLYKMWPRGLSPAPSQRKAVMGEIERAITLYTSQDKKPEALRLYRDFIPPFLPTDYSEKTQYMMRSLADLPEARQHRPIDLAEHASRVKIYEADIPSYERTGQPDKAAAAARDLVPMKDIRLWDLDVLESAARSLMQEHDPLWIEMSETLAQKGSEKQTLRALLDLEKVWKNTPRQSRLWELCKMAKRLQIELEFNPQMKELEERLLNI